MVANSRDQLHFVGKLDEVVVGPGCERLGFGFRLLFCGKDDQRHFARRGIRPVELDQRQAIHVRHDQVLKNHRRLDCVGFFDGFGRVGAEMKLKTRLTGKHSADGLADDRLVVH